MDCCLGSLVNATLNFLVTCCEPFCTHKTQWSLQTIGSLYSRTKQHTLIFLESQQLGLCIPELNSTLPTKEHTQTFLERQLSVLFSWKCAVRQFSKGKGRKAFREMSKRALQLEVYCQTVRERQRAHLAAFREMSKRALQLEVCCQTVRERQRTHLAAFREMSKRALQLEVYCQTVRERQRAHLAAFR